LVSIAMGAGLSLTVGLTACGTTSSSSSGTSGEPEPEPQVHGVDLVLVVDNSISMADKQTLLAPSIARLLSDLTNPPCFDASGAPAATQPASGDEACATGTSRKMDPVRSLHLGVISSSLGALGGTQCDAIAGGDPSTNDRAHLLSRGPDGSVVPTYQSLGYLAWDADGAMSPPGESDFDALVQNATDMVVGVGEVGCGYEMPLEAAARFLADPAPYDHLETSGGTTSPVGVDETLLAQREAFLRPDSLVAVVLLSDENDCSIDVAKQPSVLLGTAPMFRARQECATDPNDACCTSCALETPAGCPADPTCESSPMLEQSEDPINLRCYDQKRRFGFDFKYPTERYVRAFSDAVVDPSSPTFEATAGSGAPNPLFADGGRLAKHVLFTSIVGVPWQDLASDPTNASSPLKSTSQMESDGSWTHLLGANGGAPTDPFMRESTSPRAGTNPFTGEDVAATNSINGGDRTLEAGFGDLEYVCTFGLEAPVDGGECGACIDASCDNPICDGETQIGAKAYPGVRQLEIVRALGDRGIAASICSPGAASTDPSSPPPVAGATAYVASMQSLETRIATELAEPAGE
jgi:hypothetical protein